MTSQATNLPVRQAVILCGGRGTRLGELTVNCPKPLLTVAGRPFVSHILDRLAVYGFESVLLLVGPFEDMFRRCLSKESWPNMALSFVPEPEPSGTGGALRYAEELLEPQFLMLNGDTLFDIDLRGFVSAAPSVPIFLSVREVENAERYGSVVLEPSGKVIRFAEKQRVGPGLINGGTYLLQRDILAALPAQGACSLEGDIIPAYCARQEVSAIRCDGAFLDIGTPSDFARADEFVTTLARTTEAQGG